MNLNSSRPTHESYLKHRKQTTWQIVFPVVLTTLLLCGLVVWISLATFRDNGDVARWAAISTIWIVIPIMFGLLIVLAIIVGLIYLLSKLLGVTPTYTGLAQHYVYLAASYIKRGADAAVKYVIEIQGVVASVQKFFSKIKP